MAKVKSLRQSNINGKGNPSYVEFIVTQESTAQNPALKTSIWVNKEAAKLSDVFRPLIEDMHKTGIDVYRVTICNGKDTNRQYAATNTHQGKRCYIRVTQCLVQSRL
jgi:hypothetical protein